ncbi:class I SAM-dependent methyltransferase [Candidatus Woesebacteria bacterium]|jgi:SAM-dependent methyltransferase|nr:class I SAM-dependent methyltransferase [Candidatus Woesebacteria bacterium]
MNETLEHIFKKYSIANFMQSNTSISLPDKRQELAVIFKELGFTTGVEVGVLYGDYSKMLCDTIPNLHLSCVDPWELYDDLPDTEINSGNYRLKNRRGYNHTKELLAGYSADLIRKYSMDAVKDFKRGSVDFVYIDANHEFDYVMEDIIEWTRIVRPGGIVAGHDYTCFKYDEVGFQVSNAVNVYTHVHNIKPLFLFTGDKSSSWAFVKEG